MPGGFPCSLDLSNATDIGSAGGSFTFVPSNSSANTKGSWTQLIASTPSDCCLLFISLNGFNNAGPSVACDVAIGASGSELVIASNLLGQAKNASTAMGVSFIIPCNIPAGTRIALRSQASDINDGLWANAILFDGGMTQPDGYSGVDTIGFLSASTLGTAVDPGGTANVKGSYVQFAAATARDYAGFFAVFDKQNAAPSSTTFPNFLVDIAIGAGGSEVPIIPNIMAIGVSRSGLAAILNPTIPIFWVQVPAGTRMAARSLCGTNDATGRLLGVTLYGIYQ